jgi:putative toxin-antitoxin system antitoxin component (TIGR02293 family)
VARSKIAGRQRPQTQRVAAGGSRVQRQFSHDAIVSGVQAGVVKRAIEAKLLRLDEVHRLIPASTFARKVREGRKLTREEADQVARLLRIKGYAAEVFEDAKLAETWLSETNPALGERVPADLLLTDEGTRAVEAVLRRIDYGDYS